MLCRIEHIADQILVLGVFLYQKSGRPPSLTGTVFVDKSHGFCGSKLLTRICAVLVFWQ
jgi:hypothetical protein